MPKRKKTVESPTDSRILDGKPKCRCFNQNLNNVQKERERDNSDIKTSKKDSDHYKVKRTRCSEYKLYYTETESEIGNHTLEDNSGMKTSQKGSDNHEVKLTHSCSNQKHCNIKKNSDIGNSRLIDDSGLKTSQKDSDNHKVKWTRSCFKQKHYNVEKESDIDSCTLIDNSDTKTLQKESDNHKVKQTSSCSKQKIFDTEKKSEIGSCSLISKKDSDNHEVKRTCKCSKRKLYYTEKESEIGNCTLEDNSGMETSQKKSDHNEVKWTHSCSKQKCYNTEKESDIGSFTLEDNFGTKSFQKARDNREVKGTCSCCKQKLPNTEKESEIGNCTLINNSDTKTLQKESDNREVKRTSSCSKRNIYDTEKETEIGSCNLISQKDSDHYEVKCTHSCSEYKLYYTETESEIGNCTVEDNSGMKTSQKDSNNHEVRLTHSCSTKKLCNTKKEGDIAIGNSCSEDYSGSKTSQKNSDNHKVKWTRSCSKQKHYNTEKESEIVSCTLIDDSGIKTLQKESDNHEVKRTQSCSKQKIHNTETESKIGSCNLVDDSASKTSQKDSGNHEFKWTQSCSKEKHYSTKREIKIGSCTLIDNSDTKTVQKESDNHEVKRTRSSSKRNMYDTKKESEIGQKDSDHYEVKRTRKCSKHKLYYTDKESEIGTLEDNSGMETSQKVSDHNEMTWTHSRSKQKRYNTKKESDIGSFTLENISGTKSFQKARDNREVKGTCSYSKQKIPNTEKETEIGNCTSVHSSGMKTSQRDSDNSELQLKFIALKVEGFITPKLKIKKPRSRGSTRVSRKADRDRKRRQRAEMKQELLNTQINVNRDDSVCSMNSAVVGSKSDLYRQHKRTIDMQRYNTDLQFRERKKLLGRKRYNENVVYRKKKVIYASHKYRTSNKYRSSLRTASVLKYRQNFQFRRQLKVASIKRYWCSIQYRRKKKTASIYKYRDNISHREKVKAASVRKYRNNIPHREKVKAASVHKYRDNIPHKEKVKAVSVHKYRCNPEHRQSVKAYTKLQYKQASYRKTKKARQRTQYKRNAILRRKKIEKVKKQRENQIKNIENIVQYFNKEVRNGPKHVCCVCHKFKFQKQVLVCDVEKYKRKGRKQQQMANRCISEKYVIDCTHKCQENCEILNHNKLWICYTCHQHLLKGEMPVDAAANNLDLQPIPDSLRNLNSLERQLVTLRLPFMKLVRLPKGGQNGVIGPCVSVPTDIQKTTSVLPRCETDDQLLRVKLKRKIQYKGHYKYQYISTNKLHKGLKYLQDNNKWYSSVSLDTSWDNPIEEMPENSDMNNDSDEQHPAVQNSLNDPSQNDKNSDTDDEDPNQRDRGMPMDTCLQPADIGQEILDQYFDDIFCVAPGEGSTPVSMLRERGNEAMTFPVQYPDGTRTYDDDRPVSLTRTRYFNSRLLHADNRFASDSNYLFYAQYLSELEQVISKVSIALRKGSAKDHSGNSLSVEVLSDPSKLKNLFKTDQGYKFLTPIRGTPPYWQATLKDLFAMIRQLGIPTWFCTFSAADMRWTEVLEVLLQQQGSAVSPDDLDWMEKCEVLRNNSIMNAIMFNHRFHTFLREVIIRRQVIGKVKDHFHRIEFQLRGSPHSHCLFWIDGAPLLDEDDDETVCSFIDEYVSCKLPDEHDDIELHDVVSSVQQHSKGHSKSCRKKGSTCRFHFPRPPSERTFISRPQSLTDPSIELSPEQMTHKAKTTLQTLWDVITNSDLQEVTTQNIYNAAGITQEDFEEASNILTKRTSVVLERAPADIWINQYNPTLIRCWNANMDIQYVSDAYSCVMYIISYISKAEREMGMILEDAKKEAAEGNLDASQTMKQIGGAYFRQREVSAQEAAYRVCGLHLKETSRKVQFIPVGDNPVRMSLPLHRIQQKSNTMDDEDIWMPTLSERYKARPFSETFNNMCLATFCSEYRVLAASQVPKDISQTQHVYQLQNNLGYIQKRTRTQAAVVRYPRFSVKKNAELHYLSILQLFLPHRTDTQLKPDTFTNHEEFYSTGAVKLTSFSSTKFVRDIVEANRQHFEKNADALDDAQELAERVGSLEDAWAVIGPEAESDRLQCQMEKSTDTSNDDQDLSIPDLELQHKKPKQNDNIHIRSNIPSTEEIMPLMQSLNSIQKQIFYTVRQWCLDKVNGKNPKPFHLFVTGGAGTGKSHLIRCLSYQAHKILAPNSSNPDDTTVLLTAPTGVAAFNIGGTTLHQAFALPQHMSLPYQHLGDDKLNTLRSKFENLKILIIDEISMVGQELLMYVTERLRQIKQSKNAIFGNLCVIAVGDFYQLPAVRQKCVYDIRPKNYCSLWFDNFSVVQLQEIMRQRGDIKFAELLNRLRVKTKQHTLTTEDLASLEACQHNTADPETLHIFPTNAEVDEHNEKMINKVCDAYRCVFAEDFDKNPQNGRLTARETPYETSADYLPSSIYLGRGARVMLIRNVDVSDGLVNGVMGTVGGILPPPPGSSLSSAVEVTFDNDKVGINDRHKRQSNVVHIKPMEETLKNNAIRHQFPLRLAWGCTVHKVQGITTDKAVVSLDKIFNAGMAYVALSRVTSIQGLTIQDFNPDKIYCSEQISTALQKMPNFFSQPENPVQISDTLNIILHNVQGLIPHIKDMRANTDLVDSHFICLTETWMEQHTVKPAFNNYELHHNPRFNSYSSNVPLFENLKQQKHGGVGVFAANSQLFCQIHLQPCNIEAIAFQIRHLNITVVIIYRPDSYISSVFLQNLDNLLQQLPNDSAATLIMGDFNQDIMKHSSSVQKFMHNNGYQQLVEKSTTDGDTLLDHVYMKGNFEAKVDVIPTYYSYHNMVAVKLHHQ